MNNKTSLTITTIPFTQYLLPDGHQREVAIQRPPDIMLAAQILLEQNCHFDIELLTTGEVSMTCERKSDVLAWEICPNNATVIERVDKLIKDAYDKVVQT